MIRWMNESHTLAQNIASALCRMISEERVELSAISDILGFTEEKTSDILTENPTSLSPAYCVELMKALNLSPLYVLTEMGEPYFETDTNTGRVLEALNTVITHNGIGSLAEYYRLLDVPDSGYYIRMLQGRLHLGTKVILNLCSVFNINPAYIYAPIPGSPVFV